MFSLAGHLGKTVGELESTMTSAEFGEWFQIWQWEPWGEIASPAVEAQNDSECIDPLAFAARLG